MIFRKTGIHFSGSCFRIAGTLATTSQNPIETEACALPLAGSGVGSSDFDKIGTAGVFAMVRCVK
jgi:hypothetical protein